jgi:hypothetical protein
MGVLFRFLVFQGLGFSADAQAARLETHLDLLPVESRKFGACGKLFAGLREVELHGGKELGFREKPIFPVVSVHASTGLEHLEGTPGNQIEYVLCMFEKFMNGYEIQISVDFYR